jgi:hypothetical protein
VGEAEEIPLFFTLIPILALLSNYDQENCLINVGTEGALQEAIQNGRGLRAAQCLEDASPTVFVRAGLWFCALPGHRLPGDMPPASLERSRSGNRGHI